MKIKPFTTIIIIFSFISIGNIYSQEEKPGAPNEQDKQYVPDKNSIFDSKNKSNDSRATSGSNTDFKNIVKYWFWLDPFVL